MTKGIVIPFLLVLLWIGNSSFAGNKVKIALSYSSANHSEATWLRAIDSTIIPIDIAVLKNEERQTVLQSCAGILIVGGNDVEPGRYGKGDEIKKCGTIRPDRDYVDSLMITYAMQHQLPLLGICRGEQMLNVNQGGTLFTDIPTDIGKNVVHRNAPGPDHAAIAMHKINVKEGSLLQDICHVTSGEVNSLHHQSIEKIALGFSLGAVAEDGAVEAIESRQSKNFMLGVQWHPELLPLSHPLGGPIGRYFIAQAKAYADKRIQQNAPAPPTPRSNSK